MKSEVGELVSLQVGKVQRMVMPDGVRVDYRHPFWTSGIVKNPVTGPRQVTALGVEGDAQADVEVHGGPDNAVLAYDAAHYPAWKEKLGIDLGPNFGPNFGPTFGPGSFGENFTVQGFTDHEVCIGDTWHVGDDGLVLQVTQARMPCYKLARRLQQPHIVKLVHDTQWGGWYLRVLTEGPAQAGMPIRRTARPHPEWTVAAAVQIMYSPKKHPAAAQSLAALPPLSTRWREQILEAE